MSTENDVASEFDLLNTCSDSNKKLATRNLRSNERRPR
jgi:hypothetical protein